MSSAEDVAKAKAKASLRRFVPHVPKALLSKVAEIEHEISRVRRRIDSDEEKDRRDYLEAWIADFERQRRDLLNLYAGWPAEGWGKVGGD
jgi:hypothetical protein